VASCIININRRHIAY